MYSMFSGSKFDKELNNWNVSTCYDFRDMFLKSKFNQDISNWDIKDSAFTKNMFEQCQILEKYKCKLTNK